MGPKSDRFTKDIEYTMIQMVRERPLLWDTTKEEYRRTDLKRLHWDEIAEALGYNFTGMYIRFIYFFSKYYCFSNKNTNK